MIEAALLHDVLLSLITTGIGGAGAFWVALKREGRDDKGAQSRLTADLIEQVRKQLDWTSASRAQYAAELEILRGARYMLEDLLIEMRDHALAARALVHERERSMRLPETVFPPLPRPTLPRGPPAPTV